MIYIILKIYYKMILSKFQVKKLLKIKIKII